MSKKILTLMLVVALALALAFSLGGCGGKNDVEGSGVMPQDDDSYDGDGGDPYDGDGGDPYDADGGMDDWVPVNDGQDEEYFTGEWPDNEFTRQVPKPPFPFAFGGFQDGDFCASFEDVPYADALAYGEQIQAAGFDIDLTVYDQEEGERYSFGAENGAGYGVDFVWKSGMEIMLIIYKL
ncbi:MAG: hypothetical protein FWG03_05725 [Clostridiales bacterium]|nr:hypothetical protein [Clostridiales bacterium]